jgi:predicted GNAT family N-acyltransferase
VAEIVEPQASRGDITAPARLNSAHDVSRFDCGNSQLNDWLRNNALKSKGQSARTYVACEKNIVVGYYCIATGSVERRALPSKLKRQPGLPNQMPVAIIGRLARDLTYRGTGLGLDLLQDALRRIVSASEIIGVRCVLVHAIDDQAAKFWKQNEFIEYPDGSQTFYLPIEMILDAF